MSGRKPKKIKKNASDAKVSTTSNDVEFKSESLTLVDVTCPVCLSIMIRPVSLPCSHSLCLPCFDLNVSESNLACPLCRKRISVWVRKMTKLNRLTDEVLWKKIQDCFPEEVQTRLAGNDDLNNTFTSTLPPRKLSAPGEIKEEYEDQVRRVQKEEDERKREEEKASELVALQLQEEEKKQLQKLEKERALLTSGDLAFARQLRTSQLNQSFNAQTKSPRSATSSHLPSILPHSPPLGPLDIYLNQVTATTPQPEPFSHPTPIDHLENNSKQKKGHEFLGFASCSRSLVSIPSSPLFSPETSRCLKDITSQYSSDSECDLDFEENIRKGKKNKFSTHYSPTSEDAENTREVELDPDLCKTKDASSLNEAVHCDVSCLKMLSKVLDQDQNCEESMRRLVEEQKALEERLQQEKQDRFIAMRLQKEYKSVNRSKGSPDEYCLRRNGEMLQTPPSQVHRRSKIRCSRHGSSSNSPRTPATSGKQSKFRQTTLLESFTKRPRRL